MNLRFIYASFGEMFQSVVVLISQTSPAIKKITDGPSI
jgi:hypothetical protein